MGLKIALLQLLPEGTLEKQLEKGKNACIKAKNIGADIALFPEMKRRKFFWPRSIWICCGITVTVK